MVGYNPSANPKCTPKKYEEALDPKHVAISLAGEPTLYPYLGDFIELIKKRNMTSFLVTNGTRPEVLKDIEEPSQLYVSLCATDERMYQKICQPTNKGLWQRINQTLELLPSFSCPTVIRLTLVKGLNTTNIPALKKLIQTAQPTYVEPKSYMAVGFSRERLGHPYMVSPEEIEDFAISLAQDLGYNFIANVPISRVACISSRKTPIMWS
jgi:tRNA wybutosine-synthesizing protein 1